MKLLQKEVQAGEVERLDHLGKEVPEVPKEKQEVFVNLPVVGGQMGLMGRRHWQARKDSPVLMVVF